MSDVSDLRNCSESSPSNVWASVVTQLPPESSKHPPDRAIPLLNDEVAEDVRRIFPPDIVSPFWEESPPDDIPPVNVDVAAPFTMRVEVAIN